MLVLIVGGLLALIGLVLTVGGVWLAESNRLGRDQAWPSTKTALKAVGLSILIELGAGLGAAAWFVGGVIAT